MADLGALSLILGADISPLEASLGRADELINRSAAQMQKSFGKAFKFKVEVGDLAVQLTQAEGVVDRSIRQVRSLVRQPIKFNIETGDLNVQLTEAEALVNRSIQDIKAMDRSIAFNLSVRGLDDVEGLVARSIQKMSALSNSVLTIQVDDKRLTELNQHLDAKQAHYARVQRQFATPLKVLVDDSQLTVLNQKLTATEQHLSTVAGKLAATKLTPAIDLTNLNLLDSRLNNSIDNLNRTQSAFSRPIVTNVDTRQLSDLEDLLDRVEKPYKLRLDLPDTIGGLTSAIGKLALSPVTIPLKIAQNSLEGIFRGISEGLGRELTRNFSKGFSSSIEGFITKKTGMSTKEMGEQSGKYVATRGKIGAEYISQELGYKDGLRGVGDDLKAAGTSVDSVLKNPRRAARKIENKLVEALEYYQEGETDKAMNVVTESFAPMGKIARRAAGVGIRAAAQPIRIRNRAMLKGKVAEADKLAQNMEIEGYDREAADKADAIHIVTGGLDFNNGENAHFAGGLLKQMYPKAHTVTHVNKAMNQPVKRGQGVVGGMMGMMEQLQKMGGKEGKIGDMPIQKLAEMAIDLGYNPDGLEMYAKAVKIRQDFPDKPINFMGTSGGVDAVNYAVALSERAGMKNVKGVGLGLPMTNLTELASKKNFQSVVGTLDDLDIAFHNTDFLGAKRKADPASMAEIQKLKNEKFPFDASGMFSVGKTQKHVLDGGKGHAIGNSYLGNDNVMGAVNDFIARPNTPRPEIRSDIKDAASLNNFYADKFNAKRKEIPLTIAAMYRDPKALARIEADPKGNGGDYTYFSPANKNHEDDWLRITEFDGLIKDVRGQDIQGRSEQANSESKKKGLDKFIKSRREKAAKQGTTSVVAEHAAGWLDYLDLMKGGMEEYGKTGAMPYDALQKGAEYYPELRPLAAREQHKREVISNSSLTPYGVENKKKYIDQIYASGDIKKINQYRSSQKLPAIDSNYGYKDALATPDSYIKDLDKQLANNAAEIAKNQAEMARLENNSAANPIAEEATFDPFQTASKNIQAKLRSRKLQKPSIWDDEPEQEIAFVNTATQLPKKARVEDKSLGSKEFSSHIDRFGKAVSEFEKTVDRLGSKPKENEEKPNIFEKFKRKPKSQEPIEEVFEEVFEGEHIDLGSALGFPKQERRRKVNIPVHGEATDAEYEEVSAFGQAARNTMNAGKSVLNAIAKPIGQAGSVASGAEKALFTAIPILQPIKGAMQLGGTIALGSAISQNPIGQAAIHGTSSIMQSIAGAPVSQFAGMTSNAIEQMLGGALSNMPGGAGLAQSIAVEVQRAIQSGGGQVAATIGSVLSPYLVAKMGLGAAGAGAKKLFPALAGNSNLEASSQRMISGTGRQLKQLMPTTTTEPFWDIEATVVEDRNSKQIKALPPGKPKQSFNPQWPRIVEDSLKKTQSQLESAIKSGEVELAKQYQSELKEKIAGAYKLINIGLKSEDISAEDKKFLDSSVRGNLTKKSKFLNNSQKAIDMMESGNADPSDPKNQIGWSQKFKATVAKGMNQVRRNMGNEEGYFNFNPQQGSPASKAIEFLNRPIKALEFLDKPISVPKWLRNPFAKTNPVQERSEQPEPLVITKARKPPLSTLEKEAASRLKQAQERELAAQQRLLSFERETAAYRAKSNDPWLLEMGQTSPKQSNPQQPRQKVQLALPPAPQRPPAPPQPDPWKSTNYSNKPVFETKKLLSREERLVALNSQIADREDPLRKFPLRPRGGEIVLSSSRSLAINSQPAEDLYPRSIQRKLPAGVENKSEYLQVVTDIPSTARTIQQSPSRLSLPPSPPPRPSGFSQAAEQFKENPIETIRAGIILAESQARKAANSAKARIEDVLANSRGKYYLDRAAPFARSVVDDVKEKFTKVKQTFANPRQNPTAARANPNNTQLPNPVESVENAGKSVAASGNVAAQAIAPYDLIRASLSKLGDAGKLALGVFGGFTLLTMGVPAIIGLGKSVIDTAANFETLQVKLAAASDSAQTGKLTFSRLTGEADKLGISRSSALETGAFIGGTTFGTELEGKPTDRMTSQILQIAQARGLSKEQTSGLNLALSQTLGRSRTSMQEINQLTQSAGITDARVIAAKGLGYTPQQFSAIQDSPTGIDSKRFVQAFLAQGVQDSLSAKDLAQSSIGFKQEKMNAGVERLQGNIGGGVSPVYKAGLDLLTGSIEMLNSAIEKSSRFLIGLSIRLLYVGTTALLPIIVNSKLAGIAVNTMISGFSNLPQLGITVAKLAAQFVLLGVAAEVINQVGKSFQNTSKDIEEAAAKIGKSVDEISGKKIDPIDKPATAEDIGGQDWGESAKLWLQRANAKLDRELNKFFISRSGKTEAEYNQAIGNVGIDDKRKEQSDRIVAVDKVITKSSEAIASVNPAIQKSQALAGIDLELNQLDSKRSSLFAGGDPDASQLASINAKYNAKYQERDKLTSDITPTRTAIQEAINGLKGTKAKLELDFSKGQIAVPDYELAMKSVTGKLEEAEQAQRNLNDAIKSGFDNLLPWTTSLAKIVTSFEDIKTNATEAASKLSIARNNLETGGKITKGQSEYQGSIDQQRNLQSQIEKNIATVKELKAALNTKDPKAVENVQENYGVDDSTSGAQLRLKADKATSIVDKEILSKLAIIKDQEINLTGLQSQVSDSRKEMYRRIDQENRDMAVYYLGLARQVDPKDLQLEKKIASITQNRNNFLAKLNNFGTGIADGYIQAVLDIFDATKKRFEIQQQDYQARKRAIESSQDRKVDNDNRVRNAYVAPPVNVVTPDVPSQAVPAQAQQKSTPSTPDRTVRSEPESTVTPAQITRASPGVKPQIEAALKNLTPQERYRYLHTSMSVDGKTDLGIDATDRRLNPTMVKAINNGSYNTNVLRLKDRPKPTIPKATTRKSTIPTKIAPPVAQAATPVEQAPTGGRSSFITEQVSAIEGFLSGGSAKSKEILDQENAKNEEKNKTAQSENNLQEIVARQKARQAAIKSKREVEKQTRQQEFAVRNAKPQKTIQEKQQRELEDFDFNTNETKISATQYKEDLGYQVGNLNELLKEYKSKPGLKPEDIKEIERLTKLRNVFVAELKQMNTLSNGLESKIATARAAVKEQQKYDREVSVEQTSIKERDAKRVGIEAERTGIQQKIKTQPFNNALKATDRKLEEDSAMLAIQNEEAQALRALIDRERNGDFNILGTPAQVKAYMAGERKKILGTSASKRKYVKENRSQQSSVAQFTNENEKRGFDINARNLDEQAYDARDRIQAIDDKGDAPFSNDTAILQARDKKLRGIVNRKVTINKKYEEDKVKYAGSPFLADVEKQYKYSNDIDTEEAVGANKEYNFSIQEQARQRKASTYQRQRSQFEADIEILGAKTQQRKLMGQDTRVTDYDTRVTAIQDESTQKRFNYQQQKDAITATTPEAAALRTELDKLIASATTLENIKLNNLKAEFNQINDVIRETQQNTGDVIKAWVSDMKKPFDWVKLATAPLVSILNKEIDKLTAALFAPLYKSPEAPNSDGKTSGSSVVDATQGLADKIFATPGRTEKDAIESNPGLKNPTIEQAANTSPLIVAIENLTETIKSTPIESKVVSEPPTTLPTLEGQNGYINQNSSLNLDAEPLLNYKQQPNSFDDILDYPPDPTPENTIGSPPKRSILVPDFDIPPDPTPENTIGSPPERSNLGRLFDVPPPPTTREDVPSSKIFQPKPKKQGIPKLDSGNLFMDIGESLMATIDPLLDPVLEPKPDAKDSPKPKKKGIPKLSTGDVFLDIGASLLQSLFGFAEGGIKGAAEKGIAPVVNGIIGSGRSQVDNRLTFVEDGEGILTHRGIDALGGAMALSKLNKGIKLENIPRFATGGIKGANYSTPKPNTNVPTLTNNASSLSNVNASVTINNSDGKSSVNTKEDGTKMGQLINNAISAALVKEQRPGGLLYT